MPSDHQATEELPLLYDADRAAALVGLSVRTVWRLAAAREFPAPVRVGRATRWRRADIEAWVDSLRA
jgi:excisionase family DNA binding protein